MAPGVVDGGVDVRGAAEEGEPVDDADDRELGAGQVDLVADVHPEPLVGHDLAGPLRRAAVDHARACRGHRAGGR